MTHPASIAPAALQNPFLSLEVFEDAGPRISALIPAGSSQNLLAVLDDAGWESPHGRYHPFGGHRLWVAPEIPAITYLPEDSGAHLQVQGKSVRLWRADTIGVHLERSIEIFLEPHAPRLKIIHTLRNLSIQPLTAAPWAVTVLPMGSRVRIPLTHALMQRNPFLPNRNAILWSYADPADTRLHLTNDFIQLESDPHMEAIKVGAYASDGWAAAEINGWLLVKRFTPLKMNGALDLGANVEAYTNQTFVEFETLGSLRRLHQGNAVRYIETWDVLPGHLEDLDDEGHLGGDPTNTRDA
jgi:hypothetical protein